MLQTVFVNKGSDVDTLNEISKSVTPEVLEKAIDKTKLVQREIMVNGKHGMHRRKAWVKAGEEQPQGRKPKAVKKEEEKTRDFKLYHSGKQKRPDVPYMYIPFNEPSKALTTQELEKQLLIEYNKNKGKYKCSYSEFRNGPKAEQFVKEHYFISDGLSQTEECYKRNGEYTPERKKLHEQIIKEIVDSANTPPAGQKPVAILMGGGSASGKGTLRKSVVVPTLESEGIKVGISDSDDIKERIPEYAQFQDQHMETAAYRAHEESSYIADKAVDALVSQGKNLLFDGTMKNYSKYETLIDKLHKAGYEVQIVGADVPLETAYVRSDKRAEHTGRKVPHGIIKGSHQGFASTLPKLVSMVDSSVLYDNSGDGEPRVIMADGEVLDQKAYDTFIQKGQDKSNK